MGARLLDDKLDRLRTYLSDWHFKKPTDLKELQSLISTLNFGSKVVSSGLAFLQRMIQLTRDVNKLYHHIQLTRRFHQDVTMWQTYIPIGMERKKYFTYLYLREF